MPSAAFDLFGELLSVPTRQQRQRVATLRKPAPLRWAQERLQARLIDALEPVLLPSRAQPGGPFTDLPGEPPPPWRDVQGVDALSRRNADLLAQHPQLWSATALGQVDHGVLSSGFPLLDAELPGGGWPRRALTELQVQAGLLWRLLAPALGPACRAGQHVLMVAPPHAPHAPGLQAWGVPAKACLWVQADSIHERQWVLEQALKADADELAAVLVWLPDVPPRALRRVQVLAARSRAPVFLLREAAAQSPSGAALRLRVEPGPHWAQLQVSLLKRRGPLLPLPLWLHAPPAGLLASVQPVQRPWWLLGSDEALRMPDLPMQLA